MAPIPAAQSPWWLPTWTEIAVGVGLFVLTAALSLAATAWILIKLPPDYFIGPDPPPFWNDRHPLLRAAGKIGKNLLGVALVILGIILSLPGVPGQGILTILIGLMFIDLPGKRRVEQNLLRRPRVRAAINRIRRRFGKPDLMVEERANNPP